MASRSSKNDFRKTPYQRVSGNRRGQSAVDDDEQPANKSFLGKMSSLIVPSWINGWLNSDKDDQNSTSYQNNQAMDKNHKFNEFNVNLASNNDRQDYGSTYIKNSVNSTMINDDSKTLPSQSIVTHMSTIGQHNKLQGSFNRAESHSKPAFRVSAFLTPNNESPGAQIFSQTESSFNLLSTSKSPFYVGKTMYGGSSSFRDISKRKGRTSPVSKALRTTRTQVKAKPFISKKRKTVTSETAKKILNTLDKVSTPVRDSQKIFRIPLSTPSLSQLSRESTQKAENKNIDPPSQPIITKLQNQGSTKFETGFKAAKSDLSSVKFTPSETIKKINPPEPSKMKMKRERNVMHYSVAPQDEEPINSLPEVSVAVPLTIDKLPTIKFATSKNLSTFPTSPKLTRNAITGDRSSGSFQFLSPGVLGKPKELPTVTKSFSFCSPVVVSSKDGESSTVQSQSDNNVQEQPLFKSAETIKAKLNSFAKKFAKIDGSWDCPTCMIINEPTNSLCAACTEPKPQSNLNVPKLPVTSANLLTSNFTPKLNIPEPETGSWECPTCMIRNGESVLKCAACSELKPSNAKNEKAPITFVTQQNNLSNQKLSNLPDNPFALSLKPKLKIPQPEAGSWECPTCMIRNKENVLKCVACTEAKPSNSQNTKVLTESVEPQSNLSNQKSSALSSNLFGQSSFKPKLNIPEPKPVSIESTKTPATLQNKLSFKPKLNIPQPKAGTWECPTCMIRNDENVLKCVACTEAKPQSTENAKEVSELKPSIKESSNEIVSMSSSPFVFGLPSSNETVSTSSSAPFAFGLPSDSKSTFSFAPISTSEIKFGTNSSFMKPATQGSFKFGTSDNMSFGKLPQSSSSGFSFGSVSVEKTGETDAATKPIYPSIADAAKAGYLSVSDRQPDNFTFESKISSAGSSSTMFTSSANKGLFSKQTELNESTPVSSQGNMMVPNFPSSASSNVEAPSFNFGTQAPSFSSGTQAPSFNFGPQAPSFDSGQQAPSFNFGTQNVPKSQPSSNISTPFMFGAPVPFSNNFQTSTEATKSTNGSNNSGALFTFGSSGKASTTASFSFGQKIESTTDAYKFGNSGAPSFMQNTMQASLGENNNKLGSLIPNSSSGSSNNLFAFGKSSSDNKPRRPIKRATRRLKK